MASDRKSFFFKNGYWIWDEVNNGLLFVNRDLKDVGQKLHSAGSTAHSITSRTSGGKFPIQNQETVHFKDTVSSGSQAKFRKYFQRKVKYSDPDVVTIQDVKDVALYTCDVKALTLEFINYFHTKEMDALLRSLIIYFQFYLQVFNKTLSTRKETKRMLRQPIVTVLENVIRDDLADLRSMVARDYAVILMGIGDAKKFHHMNNKNNDSLSDKDRRLFECFIVMATRVVWISLHRKSLTLIEKEINRLLRTKIFSPEEHKASKTTMYDTLPSEDRILLGKNCVQEKKLLHRSPAIQELILENHDYRMLAIGVVNLDSITPRQIYLAAAYAAPEELLFDMNIPVGILGIPRKYLDPVLKPKEISTTKKRSSFMKPISEFVIPPRTPYLQSEIYEKLPTDLTRFKETTQTKQTRKQQCKLWREYIILQEAAIPPQTLEAQSTPSYMTLRTSVTPVYSKYS